MPGSILLGLSGIGGGIISNALNNQNNLAITQQTNAANMAINQAMIDYAQQAAEDADTRTRNLFNDLYSPSARVQQLKDAGLSVGLMYGQGGVGGSGTAGAQANTPSMIPVQSTQTSPLLSAELAAMLANTAKTEAETKNIEAKTEETQSNTQLIQETKKLVTEQVSKTKEETKLVNTQVNTQIEQQILLKEQQNDTRAAAALKKAQEEYQKSQTTLANMDITKRGTLDYWECRRAEQEFNKLVEETRKLHIDADNEQAIINATLMEMAARTYQAMSAGDLNKEEAELIKEQIRAAKRTNDAEEYLNTILQMGDKEGEGGGKRQGLKSVANFLLNLYRTYKSGKD